MADPQARTVSGTTPDGTGVTVSVDATGHGRVSITAQGVQAVIGTTSAHPGSPHFLPEPTEGIAFSPTTLRLLADLIEQAHQEH